MADRSGYIGRAPGDSSVIIARQTFEPTGVQTNFTFTSGYTVGYLDVYLNGSRLIVASDYTATDGSVVGLTTNAINGDVLECVAYKAFNLGDVTNAIGNFSVGGDLTVTGSITGDGSGLTGLPGQVDLWNKTAAGINTAVSVGIGTTRPDSISRVNNTSILNVGIVTAYQFYGNVTGNVTGSASTAAVPGISTQGHSVFNTINASGIVTATTFVGALTGNASGTSATVTGAAQASITSVGTLTAIDIDGPYTQVAEAVGALAIDCGTGNYFTKTINGNSTFTVSNVPASKSYSFVLELTHTSGTITWFSGVEWPAATAPTLTTGKTHLFVFHTDNGGTRWRASSLVDYTN